MIIGLTGQTGAGKSTVSNLFVREPGVVSIDADKVARQVVSNGTACLTDLALEFSISILNADGTLNRKKLASIVFGDREKLRRLNEITFPYIVGEIKNQITRLQQEGKSTIVLDAPTLFESRTDKLCDKVVVVIADPQLRATRIVQRDGLTRAEAQARIDSQHGDEYYTKRADYVIENSGDLTSLRLRVLEVLEELNKNRQD